MEGKWSFWTMSKKEREREFCLTLKTSPVENPLVASPPIFTPPFLVEIPTRKDRKWNQEVGSRREKVNIIISRCGDEETTFTGKTYKSKPAKEDLRFLWVEAPWIRLWHYALRKGCYL